MHFVRNVLTFDYELKQCIRLTWQTTIERNSIILVCSSAKRFDAILRCFSVQTDRYCCCLLATYTEQNSFDSEYV